MVAQALSGIAKDLTKMSSKSAVKFVVADDAQSTLFKWVAILTGSKNALKGVGFFVGGLLLYSVRISHVAVHPGRSGADRPGRARHCFMSGDLGTANKKAKFRQMFSNNRAVNCPRGGARLPVRLARRLVRRRTAGLPLHGAWLELLAGRAASWPSGSSAMASCRRAPAHPAPVLRRQRRCARWPDCDLAGVHARRLSGGASPWRSRSASIPTLVVVAGLIAFGVVFALNSAVHSYLILAYTDSDKVAMNVGFYYMANACGRLGGTVLSGVLYQYFGLVGCLWTCTALTIITGVLSRLLPTSPLGKASLAALGGDE